MSLTDIIIILIFKGLCVMDIYDAPSSDQTAFPDSKHQVKNVSFPFYFYYLKPRALPDYFRTKSVTTTFLLFCFQIIQINNP